METPRSAPGATPSRRAPPRRVAALVALALGVAVARPAAAEPLRLRAEALAETSAPAGLVLVEGRDAATPWLDAEAQLWAGGAGDATAPGALAPGGPADVLVLAFRAREPSGLAALRGGRFVLATGAIRPQHLDGLAGVARTPWGASLEAFGGLPVVPRFGASGRAWVVGGRLAQRAADDRATLGLSWVQGQHRGQLAEHEVGADVSALVTRAVEVRSRAAYDLVHPGVADALGALLWRRDALTLELSGTHRSPARLLPATSLFSVLGDFPADTAGGAVTWAAAPRLDLGASGAGQLQGGELGHQARLWSRLRLDDAGHGSLGLELRRHGSPRAGWTGVRAVGTQPLGAGLVGSTELELVGPDAPRRRGALWPWGLVALGWRADGWETAAAVEALASPERRAEARALARLSRGVELP